MASKIRSQFGNQAIIDQNIRLKCAWLTTGGQKRRILDQDS
jgi:hypothetical protein